MADARNGKVSAVSSSNHPRIGTYLPSSIRLEVADPSGRHRGGSALRFDYDGNYRGGSY